MGGREGERAGADYLGNALEQLVCVRTDAGCSKGRAIFPASSVARRSWYTYHRATRASLAEKIAPVRWVAITEIWYYTPGN